MTAGTVRQAPQWVDRFLGSDPGLIRLLSASQAVATIGLAMLAERIFVGWTHALQAKASDPSVAQAAAVAAVAAQHHGVLVTAILLGAIMGMIASFSAALFPSPKAQLIGFALMPIPMIAGLALGLALAPHRALALTSFVAVLAVGAYCRRFGPHGFVGGMVLFMGDFFGFFLNGEVHLADLGWLSAEIVLGVLVAILANFTLFYPSRRAALRRMRHSYGVRAREVARSALDMFDVEGDRSQASRRLHRRLIRLNEAALLIDAQLGQPGALPPGYSARELHQRLFDSELALTNLARLAESLADVPVDDAQTVALVREALGAVAESDLPRAELAAHELLARVRHRNSNDATDKAGRDKHVVAHRFAISVLGLTEAALGSPAEQPAPSSLEERENAFQSSVVLFGGWLPGSAIVSTAASLESSAPSGQRRLRDRLRVWEQVGLAAHSRVAIQMSVAVTAAILLGDLVSGRRFYWAVLAAFITFMGANNAGEQLRKGFFRVAGTVVGVLLGAIGAHLIGDRTDLAIAVILASLFFGLYLMRISYGFMVIGITIMVSQLYVQLDEFSNSLLVLRLEETALGAGVTAVVVLCVLPLHTGRVARVAVRHYVQALSDVIEPAVHRLTQHSGEADLGAALRRIDVAYQTLLATTIPMRLALGGSDGTRERFLQPTAAARHYARNLLADTASGAHWTCPAREQLDLAASQLTASLAELIGHVGDTEQTARTYVRSAALFDLVTTHLEDSDYLAPEQLTLRDFQLVDGAMATLAQSLGLTVRALDTTRALDIEQSDDTHSAVPSAIDRAS